MVLSSTAESTAFSCSMAAAAGHLFSALEHRSPPPASLPEGGVGAWGGFSECLPLQGAHGGWSGRGRAHWGTAALRTRTTCLGQSRPAPASETGRQVQAQEPSSVVFHSKGQVHPRQMPRCFMEGSRAKVISPSGS